MTTNKSKHVSIAGYGDRIYEIRDSSLNSLVHLFADIAKRTDYVDVAYAAIIECTRHKDDDIREARRVCGDDKELWVRMKNAAYHFFSRTTTILKAIAQGHWAALDGYGYNSMYTIAAMLLRPERQRRQPTSLTRTRLKYMAETLSIADEDQLLEILGLVTSRLRQSSTSWAVQAARVLEAALDQSEAPKLAQAAAKVRLEPVTAIAAAPVHGMRRPTHRAAAEAAFQPA